MKNKTLLFALCSLIFVPMAHADWQYGGTYVGDGVYQDDGLRFTLAVRGGASVGFASAKNMVGALTNSYWALPDGSSVITATYYDQCGAACDGYVYAGTGDLSAVPPREDYNEYSFSAGASIGFTVPYHPQWRLEVGWDHMTETEYNSSPMFKGDLALSGGEISGVSAHVQSGAVESKMSTDVISAMAFYDFYSGLVKPSRTVIPYIGLGIGYADTDTVLNLSDPYGDLSADVDLLQNFGELGDYDVLQFYRSEKSNSNVAGIAAIGLSYGLTDRFFLDFGARLTYIPRVKFALSNADGSRNRDWFALENLIYANVMLGLRFEF